MPTFDEQIADLDEMLHELKYKFLEEKGSAGGSLEEFQAYLLAAVATDEDLKVKVLLSVLDEDESTDIDTNPNWLSDL